ncbi:5-formyltetrahydrofolate cyclo-ligase [Paenalkalicoccus suaedae]|uniref:5-formyltetrahydrofolate cyclo-ligase n=1 Tax=Paenalkalicoccus suaedae TaxID=2592382 RepID=A0A859FC38_9BACI|nr:5-formyltetrahydrofolate cyclo-ligase [Paenalkalicoccus suaedae]QKS70913.1 5-formyltetrahydrofolate cyclo-ligase [Paenalkalicoccus suaedae]
MNLKKEYRKKGKELLKHKSSEEVSQLHSRLFLSSAWKQATCIAMTISMPHEIDTYRLIEQAWEENKRVCVPKSFPDNKELRFYELTDFAQLEETFFQLKEPNTRVSNEVKREEIDVILVPGLMFDLNGYRVGYGGGYYDRYLASSSALTLSICLDEQLIDHVPRNTYDVKVDQVLTPQREIYT